MIRRKKTCPKCSKEISFSNFERHLQSCNPLSAEKIPRCEICSKEFKTFGGLAGHKMRSHNSDPEFQRKLGERGVLRQKEMRLAGHVFPKCVHSEETKDRLSRIACARLAKHSKYSKNVEYRPGVILESSYEVRVAEILDELGVEWEKVRRGFAWDDNGTPRRYIPDFYLPVQDIFLDPKNDYLITKDRRKITSAMKINNITVVVLSNDTINKEFIELMVL
jgi:hypothetical protein